MAPNNETSNCSPNTFNPRMLVLAREYQSMTQTALAKELGMTQGTVSKIEEGIIIPDEDLLDSLAAIFGRPKAFFVQSTEYSLTLDGHFRKKSALPKKILRVADAKMNIERLQINKLITSSPLEIDDVPDCDPDEYQGGPQEIARLIRRHLNVPSGPIENLVELVERAGCIVRFIDFGSLKIDGFSVLSGVNVPIIFINKAFPPDRRRLTLAHEFGHVVMHRGRGMRPNTEDEAFEFGGELLMPEAEIKSTLYPLNLEKLSRLKLKWKVSMGAILQHAKRIGAVNPRYYTYMRSQLSKHGYTRDEPYNENIELEKPNLLIKILRHYRNDLDYDIDEMAKLIFATHDEVKSLSRSNHEQFSIVA